MSDKPSQTLSNDDKISRSVSNIDINFVIPDKKQRDILTSFLTDIIRWIDDVTSIPECKSINNMSRLFICYKNKNYFDNSPGNIRLVISQQRGEIPIIPIPKRRCEVFIFYGLSESGKSYLLNQIKKSLGDFMKEMSPEDGLYIFKAHDFKTPLLVANACSDTNFDVINEVISHNYLFTMCNLIYVTNKMPPKKILKKCTLIHFPHHIPSLIQHIKTNLNSGLSKKMVPDLAKIALNYYL